MEFTDYDTRLAAYAVIVDDQDRLLLALWNEPAEPLWTLPGGGVDLHESVEDGVVREVREETGYDVELDGLLCVDAKDVPPERRISDTDRWLRGVRVIYRAHVVGGELAREVGGSTDEARWFPLAEVPGLPHVSQVDLALEHLA